MNKEKLIYILPEYNTAVDSHFFYLYDFVDQVGKELDIYVIIEKAKGRARFDNIENIYQQKFSWLIWRFKELFLVLLKLKMQGYKKIYVHYSYIGALCAILLGFETYYWNCGMPWLYHESASFFDKIKNKYPLEFILPRVTLVTGNNTMKKMYQERYHLKSEHIAVMPNWIDRERISRLSDKELLRKKYRLPLDRKIILFVHHLSKRKGAHFLAEISKKLPDDYFLIVIGDGPYKKQLFKDFKSIKTDKYCYLGAVSNQGVLDFFRLADLYIMPSQEEGFPRVLLEAQSAGLPYVAFDVGGTKEISPPLLREFVVPYGDVEKFVALAQLFFEDEELRKRASRDEQQWVEQFDKHRAVRRFVDIVRS